MRKTVKTVHKLNRTANLENQQRSEELCTNRIQISTGLLEKDVKGMELVQKSWMMRIIRQLQTVCFGITNITYNLQTVSEPKLCNIYTMFPKLRSCNGTEATGEQVHACMAFA